MKLEHKLSAIWSGGDVDVRFFAYANLVAETVHAVGFAMGVECQIVKPAVSEPVAVI